MKILCKIANNMKKKMWMGIHKNILAPARNIFESGKKVEENIADFGEYSKHIALHHLIRVEHLSCSPVSLGKNLALVLIECAELQHFKHKNVFN